MIFCFRVKKICYVFTIYPFISYTHIWFSSAFQIIVPSHNKDRVILLSVCTSVSHIWLLRPNSSKTGQLILFKFYRIVSYHTYSWFCITFWIWLNFQEILLYQNGCIGIYVPSSLTNQLNFDQFRELFPFFCNFVVLPMLLIPFISSQ